MAFTVNIFLASPATPLAEGGKSMVGHMWYEISADGAIKQYGFAPAGHGSPFGAGKVMRNDTDNYQNPYYRRTLEISQAQYNIFNGFGQNPAKSGFSMGYNGATNSCIDFTWKALNLASLRPRRFFGRYEVKGFEGEVKPLQNVEWIRSIAAAMPKSSLNKERFNRLPLGWELILASRNSNGAGLQNA
jgi:hypothetical protein